MYILLGLLALLVPVVLGASLARFLCHLHDKDDPRYK
jgi:hypothetical protein